MCKQMLIGTESQLHEHVNELTIIKLFEITDVGIFFVQNKNTISHVLSVFDHARQIKSLNTK